jgi:hypothetical protein
MVRIVTLGIFTRACVPILHCPPTTAEQIISTHEKSLTREWFHFSPAARELACITLSMIAGSHRSGAPVLVLVLTLFLLAVLAAFTIRGRARPALQRKSTTGHLNRIAIVQASTGS